MLIAYRRLLSVRFVVAAGSFLPDFLRRALCFATRFWRSCSGWLFHPWNRVLSGHVIVMFRESSIFSRSGGFIAGLILALGSVFAPVHSTRALDNSWHEMRFILDWSVDAPYFSFRCYHATKGAIHRWQSTKPKGLYYKCSGKGDKRPAIASIQLKNIFFRNTGKKLKVTVCTALGNAHTCVRIRDRRGHVVALKRCGTRC